MVEHTVHCGFCCSTYLSPALSARRRLLLLLSACFRQNRRFFYSHLLRSACVGALVLLSLLLLCLQLLLKRFLPLPHAGDVSLLSSLLFAQQLCLSKLFQSLEML